MDRRAFLVAALAAAPVLAERRRDNRDECARIDAALADIETERRAGYTAKRGRKLRLRREKLEDKRRQKCR